MIKLSIPFLLSNLEQIPFKTVNKNNYLLEGNIFDASLINPSYMKAIQNNVYQLASLAPDRLTTLHFPTENANYLHSSHLKKKLFQFIDFALHNKINRIVLHTNYIQSISEYDVRLLPMLRLEYTKLFSELNSYIKNTPLFICIENLPIIGNDGDDFDSIFVFPKDFEQVAFSNIKIVWDLGHWAFTVQSMNLLSNFTPYVKTPNIKFNDFMKLRKNIFHFQFSSFKQITFPNIHISCQEGVPPQDGDYKEDELLNTLRQINSWKGTQTMTLEIKDKDYTKRHNLLKTIDWFEKYIL